MKYKALMLDIDGTTIPYDYGAIPSDTVATAVKQAQEKVEVFMVTGRSYGFIEHILDKLGIVSGLVVVNNGAQVMNIETKSFLYDKPIAIADANEIIAYLLARKLSFYVKQDTFKEVVSGGHFKPGTPVKTPYMIFTDEIHSAEAIDAILKDLSHITTISYNKGHHKTPDKFSFNICHAEATKLHGIEVLLKETGIQKEEVIAIGDGYNDFPLLMAAGLKVAMGNAIPELKAIADVIAPSVDNDGVAHIINEYILTPPAEPV